MFTWSVTTDDLIAQYEFQWKKSTDTEYNSSVLLGKEFTLFPVISGVTYDYRVRAFNFLGVRSAFASGSIAATKDATAPNQPSAPTVTAGLKQLTISWDNYTKPADFAFMQVFEEVYGSVYQRGTSAGTSFAHTGLTQNTTHTYKIRAVDFSGNESAVSLTANGTVLADTQGATGATGPAGPSGLIVTLNGADIPMNNQTGEPPVETGVDPRPNNSTTQGKLDEAFLALNPLLSQMSEITQDAIVWGRFVLTKEQTFTTTAGQTTLTISGGHTPDKYTRIIYDVTGNEPQQLKSGDFTSAPIDAVTGNSTSITLTDQFLNRLPNFTVPAGKTLEVYYIQASARKWDYTSQNWTDNSAIFDSPVIFSPLVLSKEVLTEALQANQITANQLVVNKDVDLLDGAAWRIGKSDYNTNVDGIFFGNPAGSGATNYGFAFTATSNSGTVNEHGIEITPQHTKLIQPTITKQATGTTSISDKQTTQSITIKSSSTNPNAQSVTINAIGGGGGGAGAENQSGSAGAGGNTTYTLTITGGPQAGTYNVTASGGAAGTGYGAAKTDGDAGEDSARESGGYGGGAYGVGGAGTLGSGGGGGGGRDYNWNTSSRKGGGGGGAGSHVSNSYDISAATSVSLNITAIGAGGTGMSSNRGNGGAGGTGVLYGSIQTEGLDPVELLTASEYRAGVLGRDQVYNTTAVSGSNLVLNQVYYNNTTQPIFASMYIQVGSSIGGAIFFDIADNVNMTNYTSGLLIGDDNKTNFGSAIAPAGYYYRWRTGNGTSTTGYYNYFELRS